MAEKDTTRRGNVDMTEASQFPWRLLSYTCHTTVVADDIFLLSPPACSAFIRMYKQTGFLVGNPEVTPTHDRVSADYVRPSWLRVPLYSDMCHYVRVCVTGFLWAAAGHVFHFRMYYANLVRCSHVCKWVTIILLPVCTVAAKPLGH